MEMDCTIPSDAIWEVNSWMEDNKEWVGCGLTKQHVISWALPRAPAPVPGAKPLTVFTLTAAEGFSAFTSHPIIRKTMLQTQWGGIAARISGRHAQLTSRIQLKGLGSRAYTRPCAPTPSKRVQVALSRVSSLTHTPASLPGQAAHLTTKGYLRKSFKTPSVDRPVLHSAFPTKTVIFLVVVIVASYYLVQVEILEELDWRHRILESFHADAVVTPLHFWKDPASLNTWIKHDLPILLGLPKDPELAKQASEFFHELAHGWEIKEEDAAELNIPVTHGIRLWSNTPSVSFA